MAETQIEWTDATWNPVAGCSIVTAGCTHCYAMEMARRLEAMGVEKYVGLTRKTGKRTVWNGVVRDDRDALSIPLRWRKPRKIFVNSMSDLFHERVSDEFVLDVWQVMRETPHHNYQILTKRPERMAALVAAQIGEVLPNVWLGTSIENRDVVHRIEHLRNAPAAIRFISFEPLIGPVGEVELRGIHWAIVGGESGKSARPIREEWIDEVYAQCLAASTAFFFKQWGTWGKDNRKRSKKANGREYRGQTWDEMPTAPPVSSELL
jgi:protein gp37